MEMTPLQIASEYRTGKNKTKTIKVLAELNAVTQRRIAEILQEQGEELPTVWENTLKEPLKRKPRGPKGKGVPAREIGEAILEAVTPDTSTGAAAPPSPQGEGREERIAMAACALPRNDSAALSLDEIRHAALSLIYVGGPLEPERFQGFCKGIAALVADLEALVEKRTHGKQ